MADEPLLGALSQASRDGGSAGLTTVVVAFLANIVVAIAKTSRP
jgi:hypothetical protein